MTNKIYKTIENIVIFGLRHGIKEMAQILVTSSQYIFKLDIRGGSRTAATSKMERFVMIVNGFQPLTIITRRSILNVAAVLDPLWISTALLSGSLLL